MTSRLQLRNALLGFAAISLLSSAASAQGTLTPKKGGTLVTAVASEPPLLNAQVSSADRFSMCYTHEGLVALNLKTNKFDPLLAESWTISPDGRTYTFKLRKTNWHDGTPFTAEDVRYTIADVAAKIGPTFATQVGKNLASVTALDPQTVEMKLLEPYGPFLSTLQCGSSGAILPAHLYKGTDPNNNPANLKAVGTGPFKLADWVRGDHIRFVRNEKYWDEGKPYLDAVVVKFIPNAGARTRALLAGEVDYIPFQAFPPSDGKTVEANPSTKRELTGVPPGMLYLFFNMKKKPFDDVKVRQALLVATDRNYIFNNAFFGLGRPGQAPWTTQLEWAHDPSISYDASYPFNPEKAAQILEEAGYKADASGVRLRMAISYEGVVPERNQTAQALQGMWRRAGVELSLAPQEAAVLVPRVHKEGNFDVYITGYTSLGDPALGVSRVFTSTTIGAAFGNASSYSNPEVDALFDKAGKLTTYEERGAVYKQIEAILMRDLPAVTLHDIRGYDASTKKLNGAWGWFSHVRLGNAWLEP